MKKRMYAANFLFRKAIFSFCIRQKPIIINGQFVLFDAPQPHPDPLRYLLKNDDFSSRDLHGDISKKLNRKYLSVCEQSEDEIRSTRKYYSKIIE